MKQVFCFNRVGINKVPYTFECLCMLLLIPHGLLSPPVGSCQPKPHAHPSETATINAHSGSNIHCTEYLSV